MTCNQCNGSGPSKIKGGKCTPPVIEIKNPPEATLFHRVDVPASMGDETEYPPEAGLYKNTLLHYEASNNSYLYSSDGIPTKVNGVDGKDGAIQYTAGTGIDISDQNVISATGSIAVAWGDITGDLSNQTDLNNALGAKQDTLTAGANITIDGNNEISATDTTYNDFVGTDGVSAGTHGLVPAPATTDTNAFLKGDGTWGTPPGTTYTAGANIQINGSTISATDTTYSDFGGATTLVAGSAGLVPAPTTSDPDKFLKGDGTWQTPPGTTYTAGRRITISANNEISADGLITLSYGHSTWNDFITAYTNNEVVYCRASSGSNPGVGTQTRLAFMAYVNNEANPTEVEFQYVRSVSTKSAANQSDNVFVYKLTNADGGTWTVETRPVMVKISAGTNMTSSYSNNVLTLNATSGGGSTITLTDTDPGEGSALAADNFIGVYGIDAFNGDYATAEAATGTKWINGKEIYKKTYYIASLPNATNVTYDPGISNLDYVVKIEGSALRSSDYATFPLPFAYPTAANCISLTYIKSTSRIQISTGVDRSSLSAYVTIYYTKTV